MVQTCGSLPVRRFGLHTAGAATDEEGGAVLATSCLSRIWALARGKATRSLPPPREHKQGITQTREGGSTSRRRISLGPAGGTAGTTFRTTPAARRLGGRHRAAPLPSSVRSVIQVP